MSGPTQEELQTIGAYVVWLERCANNVQQVFAHTIIENAPLWAEAQLERKGAEVAPVAKVVEWDIGFGAKRKQIVQTDVSADLPAGTELYTHPPTDAAKDAQLAHMQSLCAVAYQLAGTVGAPSSWLDALGDAANGQIGERFKGDPIDLLPIAAGQLTEIDELRQQLDAHQKALMQVRKALCGDIHDTRDLMELIEAQGARLAAAEKDAELYLHLRNDATNPDSFGSFTPYVVQGQTMEVLEGDRLDAEVRAAIAGTGGKP